MKKCSLWCWHKRSQDVWIRKGSAFIICAVINFASGALITLEVVFLITCGTQRPLIVFQRRGTNIFLLEVFQCKTGSPVLHMFRLPTLLCWMVGEWNKEPGSRRVGRNMLQWFPMQSGLTESSIHLDAPYLITTLRLDCSSFSQGFYPSFHLCICSNRSFSNNFPHRLLSTSFGTWLLTLGSSRLCVCYFPTGVLLGISLVALWFVLMGGWEHSFLQWEKTLKARSDSGEHVCGGIQ